MYNFLTWFAAAAAVVFVASMLIVNRASGRMLGKDAFAKRERHIKLLEELAALGKQVAADPNSSEADSLRQRAQVVANDIRELDSSTIIERRSASNMIIGANAAVAAMALIFSIGAVWWMIRTIPGPISYGAAGVIAFIIVMQTFALRRWLRGRRFLKRVEDSMMANTDIPAAQEKTRKP